MTDGSAKRKIFYLGDDSGYWDGIKYRLKTLYPDVDFLFKVYFHGEIKELHKIFKDIVREVPKIIYIDFSLHTNNMIYLSQLIKREIKTSMIPTVGLVDSAELLDKCSSVGVDFLHIKCGEMYDAVYDPYLIAFPKQVKKPEFANAKFQKDVELIEDFRVGYIAPTFIHIEGNMLLGKGERTEISTKISKKLIPSNNYIVKDQFSSDLYYDHKFAYDLDYTYVDPPEMEDDEDGGDEQSMSEKLGQDQVIAGYKNELNLCKKKIREWVIDQVDIGAPKKTKILIYDDHLTIFEANDKPLDSYPYAIRSLTAPSEALYEIDRFRPSIIVYQFCDPPKKKEDEEDDKNKDKKKKEDDKKKKDSKEKKVLSDVEKLALIISKIKSIDHYGPFLILFNSRFTSQSFQDSYKYQYVLTNKGKLDLEHVIPMAALLEKKQKMKLDKAIQQKIAVLRKKDPMKYRKLSPLDFQEQRYYPKAKHNLTYGSLKYPITLISMTESEFTFRTEIELELANYRMNFPVAMSVRIVPIGDKKYESVAGAPAMKEYHAMIHSVGEMEKNKIRQFVNEIFFSSLNEERAKEAEAFQELNKTAKQKRDKSSGGETEKLSPEDALKKAEAALNGSDSDD